MSEVAASVDACPREFSRRAAAPFDCRVRIDDANTVRLWAGARGTRRQVRAMVIHETGGARFIPHRHVPFVHAFCRGDVPPAVFRDWLLWLGFAVESTTAGE